MAVALRSFCCLPVVLRTPMMRFPERQVVERGETESGTTLLLLKSGNKLTRHTNYRCYVLSFKIGNPDHSSSQYQTQKVTTLQTFWAGAVARTTLDMPHGSTQAILRLAMIIVCPKHQRTRPSKSQYQRNIIIWGVDSEADNEGHKHLRTASRHSE